ncbi:type 1 fimbrial protein [Pseudomonas tructae]|uniref:Type 1 fimbrial protein n=1 Tax=Pseudomonas tructae TaxID=2518644 RepID=A0A411MGJ6_9PSED|nr:fimbrial protein [Pseudomonas tructae]QBF25958.1 type 1 fimbrial protein [Pseudomonas tructae]
MKKSILGFALSLPLLASMSLTAQAADGQIEFTGSISGTTCTINGGAGGQNFTVAMAPAHVSQLAAAGHVAERQPFNIQLTNCTPGTGNVDISFLNGPSVDLWAGRLNVDAGGAQNVQIQLLNANALPIRIGAPTGSQNTIPVPLVAGAATLNYYSEYYATGVATPGAANTRVQYLVNLP